MKKLKFILRLFVLISVLFLFIELERYHSFPLNSSEPIAEVFFEEGVFLTAKAYSPHESHRYLNRNLPSQGYQPVQITIHNNTPRNFSISEGGIDFPLVPSKRIVSEVSRKAIRRSIAFKVASLFFWPFTIIGTIEGIKSFHHYLKLRKDFAAKSIKPYEELIPAYSIVHRIFFIRTKDSLNCVNIYLKDQDSEKYSKFHLHVNELQEIS